MKCMRWLRRRRPPGDGHSTREMAELVERVTRLDPRLRLISHYARQLRPALEAAHRHVRQVVTNLPEAHDANAQAWGTDPYIHAFFATPRDVELTFSRAPSLREFFDAAPAAQTAHAVLGMSMSERHTFGVALEGDVMRTEVPQTLVNFSDHQVRIIAGSDTDLREEIVRRMFDQLALEALARFTAGPAREAAAAPEQTLLVSQLHLLEREGTGLRAVVGSADAPDPAEQAELRSRIDRNTTMLSQQADRTGALERHLACLVETLHEAPARFALTRRRLRLSATNVLLDADTPGAAHELEVMTAHVPGDPPLVRTFMLVRFARADMVPARTLLEEAERLL